MALRSQWLALLLLAFSSNLDNLEVGLAYGVRRVRVPLTSNLLIAIITGASTLIATLAGGRIGDLLRPRVASQLGGLVLIGLGTWIAFQEWMKRGTEKPAQRSSSSQKVSDGLFGRVSLILKNPYCADQDSSKHIDSREAVILACALSLNNVVNAVAAGVLHFSPLLLTASVMALSIITLWLGVNVGSRLALTFDGAFTGIASGLLLVFIGIMQIVPLSKA